MPDIITVFACLSQCLNATTLRQLGRVTEAMLSMTGRVTMRGIARWAGPGGSYRTVQRLFTTSLSWGKLQWLLIRHHLLEPDDVILMGGDEVVVTKSGKMTYGLDRFFSSLYGKTVPGLGFLSLSLISVKRRTSYPIMMEQIDKKQPANPPDVSKTKSQGQRGRPPGSTNRNRREVVLSPYLRFVQETMRRLLALIGTGLKVMYFVYDGAFGHNEALHMVKQLGLQMISKLRHDAALYFPYDGPYAGRGKRKKYGHKLDHRNLAEMYLKASFVEEDIKTTIYQMHVWHKKFRVCPMYPTWFSGVFCGYKTPNKTINYVSFPIFGVLTEVDKRASLARRNDRKYQKNFLGCHQQYSNALFVLSLKSLNCKIILKRWTVHTRERTNLARLLP